MDILESLATTFTPHRHAGFAVAAGVVKNNVDLILEGRVQVRIPTRPSYHPWARIAAQGGSSGRGFMWIPNVGDEVLVAFSEDDLSNAYILGGLWSTMNRPPASNPLDFLSKKVIQTGATSVLGHKIEFDDAKQSITIRTSTDQSITIDPFTISLSNVAGTVSIVLDNKKQAITITAAKSIDLNAGQSISLTASSVSVKSAKVDIDGVATNIKGAPIKLNC
jgi:uncharacterized protein involved in type VI secretion and phage assembly